MVHDKQAMQLITAKEIVGDEMDQQQKMKGKNMINVVRSTNRSPKNQQSN